MTWFFLAIAAALATGAANVFDKMLLYRRGLSDPWTYVFWPASAGFLAVVLALFGATFLPVAPLLAALAAGALFILGAFLMMAALRDAEASVVMPIIGGSAPVATYVFSVVLLDSGLGATDVIGLFLMVLGSVLLLRAERGLTRRRSSMRGLAGAALFGLSNALKKYTFAHGSLLTGLMWISMGGALLALFSLLMPAVRKNLSSTIYESETAGKALYFANRLLALVGTLLVSVAIAYGHPALVDATQSAKYMVIFFGGWLLLKENFSGRVLARKLVATLLILGGLAWLGMAAYARSIPIDDARPIVWGVTFSSKYARALGTDWKESFLALAEDLRPAHMRLVAYWDDIENARGSYDFNELDWMMDMAGYRGIRVVLAMGMKVPRWPECHVPAWAQDLSLAEREEALHAYMQHIVERYRGRTPVVMWQVENEPFLLFGHCAPRPEAFLEKEIALVKILDPSRPVLVTDGGEFGLWKKAIESGDVFGTTMYRKIYPPSIGFLVGVVEYPFAPSFFRFKTSVLRRITGERDTPFIVAELQGEPWGRYESPLLPYTEQVSLFPPAYFRDTIAYARQTGFHVYYLWGAEWWYFVKEKHGDARYWEIAKEVFGS